MTPCTPVSRPARSGHRLLLCAALGLAGACDRPRESADDRSCGASGEPCCDATVCDPRLVCVASACQRSVIDAGIDAGPDDEWSQWPAPPDVPPDSEYIVSSEGSAVTDSVTGLVWQRVTPMDPCPTDGNGVCTWPDARTYCSGLSLGGVFGWRLPTMVELVSLVDLGAFDPAIDSTAFPATPSGGFWTSSVYASEGGGAWVVGFDSGETTGIGEEGSAAVRCVR